uniref:Uncharacterized protein n=1 Tax=Ascaris lumbricoides TaxID=6252 RepID=A0A0M3I812_ASCLU
MGTLRWEADIDSMAAALCFDLDIYMCTATGGVWQFYFTLNTLNTHDFVDLIVPTIGAVDDSSIYHDPELSASK